MELTNCFSGSNYVVRGGSRASGRGGLHGKRQGELAWAAARCTPANDGFPARPPPSGHLLVEHPNASDGFREEALLPRSTKEPHSSHQLETHSMQILVDGDN